LAGWPGLARIKSVLDLISLSVLTAYALVSLATALVYFMVSTTLGAVITLLPPTGSAPLGVLHPPAASIRRELHDITRRCRRYGTAALLFCVSLGVLLLIGDRDPWSGIAAWTSAVAGLVVSGSVAYAMVRFVRLAMRRRRLRLLLNADLAVAERLGEVQRRGHCVFHAVPVGDLAIDHVVVGPLGVFAIHVVLPARPGVNGVRLTRGMLTFEPDAGEYSLAPITEAYSRLAKELARVVGHRVKLVPALIVPGCRVLSRDDEQYLLTNEQNCVAMVGWKDTDAYLMDDEVAKISEWLAARCRTQRRWPWFRGGQVPQTRSRRPRLA
jgi:hypothetical protein